MNLLGAPLAAGRFLKWILRGKQESCEACGSTFTCGAAAGSCWCAQEKLSAATLRELQQKYSHCLCPTCLQKARTPGAPL